MNEPLEQFLRDADRTARATTRDLNVDAIYERVHRRRVRRVAIRSLAVVVVASAALLGMLAKDQRATVVRSAPRIEYSGHSVAAIEAELKSIDAEIDRRESLVNKLVKVEDQTRREIALRRRGALPDPTDEANQQLENAAFAMVYQANRIAQTAGNEPAQNVYREVVAYFPDTPSAEVARQRLTR